MGFYPEMGKNRSKLIDVVLAFDILILGSWCPVLRKQFGRSFEC
jgi:hypothetical protein